MKKTTRKTLSTVLFLLIVIVSFIPTENVFAVTSLTLSPNSGPVGSTVTASGSGFTGSSQQVVTTTGGSTLGLFGRVASEFFNGLPVGQTITQIGTNIISLGNQSQSSINIGNFIGTTALMTVGGIVTVEQFTALPSGATITSIGFNIITDSNIKPAHVRIKLFTDSSGAPGSLLAESGSQLVQGTGLQNFTISGTIPVNGIVWAGLESDSGNLYLDAQSSAAYGSVYTLHTYGPGPNPFGGTTPIQGFSEILTYHDTTDHVVNHILSQGAAQNLGPNVMVEQFTGLPGGLFMSSVCFNVGTSDSANIRVKLYNDNSGAPGTLLAESGSTPVRGPGYQCAPITATIPGSGIMWAGYEADNTLRLYYQAAVLHGSVFVPHTYGPGPNPFGSGSIVSGTSIVLVYHDILAPHMRVKLYSNNAGLPGTLLAESGSQLVQGTGLQNFTISGTIPGDGAVWASLESDSISSLQILSQTTAISSVYTLHAYGPGPNPFGSTTTTGRFYEQITYTSNPLSMFFDGSLLAPPSPVTKDASGSFSGVTFSVPSTTIGAHTVNATEPGGLFATSSFTVTTSGGNPITPPPNCDIAGVCGSKSVNYTYYRTTDFKNLILTAHVLPTPFNIECNYINGTFATAHKWINFTNVNTFYNQSVHVPFNQNVYVGCYGSGLLLSFMSPGNATLPVQGAQVFNSTLGVTLGAPIGVFFIAMLASLGNQRTGPIYVVVTLAAIGIMSALLFFTVSNGAWALVLITGFLGIFVGRKIF